MGRCYLNVFIEIPMSTSVHNGIPMGLGTGLLQRGLLRLLEDWRLSYEHQWPKIVWTTRFCCTATKLAHADLIDVPRVASEFVSVNERRLQYFGTISWTNLYPEQTCILTSLLYLVILIYCFRHACQSARYVPSPAYKSYLRMQRRYDGD